MKLEGEIEPDLPRGTAYTGYLFEDRPRDEREQLWQVTLSNDVIIDVEWVEPHYVITVYRFYWENRFEQLYVETPAEVRRDVGALAAKYQLLPHDSLGRASQALHGLSPNERIGVMASYCKHCGSDDPGCQCWNDE